MSELNPGTKGSLRILWRELSDGTAGAVTRIIVSLSMASLLAAAACIFAFVWGLSLANTSSPPPWIGSRRWIRVTDDMMAICLILAGVAYLPVLFWIWSRHRRSRGIWLGAAMTFGIWIVAIGLMAFAAETISGDEGVLMVGVFFVALCITLIVWLQLYRRYVSGRALYGPDHQIDLRCPKCGYRMVGLREARCPECGTEYTLDDLVGKQDFEVLRLRRIIMPKGPESVSQAQSTEPGRAGPETAPSPMTSA